MNLVYGILWLLFGCRNVSDVSSMSMWSALVEDAAVLSPTVSTVDADKIYISGQLFFNDLRQQGSFDRRYGLDGVLGSRCPFSNVDCNKRNYLSALDVSVEIHSLAGSLSCENPMMVGSVRHNAVFELYFPPKSNCLSAESIEIGVRYVLRRCDDVFCGALEYTNGETWSLWHPDARPNNPLRLSLGEAKSLMPALFQPEGVESGDSDLHATAANHYATLIDTVHAWHDQRAIPFQADRYGELRVKMPAGYETRGGTQSATEIHLPGRDSGWIKGNLTAHEYGHALHLRAWGGRYGWNGPTHPEWSGFEQAHPRIAFKEGFANFAMRVGLHTNRCHGAFDDNENAALAGTSQTGQDYPRNVGKFLCDWHDEITDDDTNLSGEGDVISSPVADMWSVLVEMNARPEAYGGDTDEGLGLCDFISSHLASIADPAERAARERAVISTARNNKIDCGWL